MLIKDTSYVVNMLWGFYCTISYMYRINGDFWQILGCSGKNKLYFFYHWVEESWKPSSIEYLQYILQALPWKMLHYRDQKQDIFGYHQHKNEQLGHAIGWCCQVLIRNPQRIWILIQNPGAHYMSVHALYFYGHQWEHIVFCSESKRQSTGKLDHLCQISVLDGSGGWGDQPYKRLWITQEGVKLHTFADQ